MDWDKEEAKKVPKGALPFFLLLIFFKDLPSSPPQGTPETTESRAHNFAMNDEKINESISIRLAPRLSLSLSSFHF